MKHEYEYEYGSAIILEHEASVTMKNERYKFQSSTI